MNELAVLCKGGSVLYYPTYKTTAKDAYVGFEGICKDANINIDNLLVKKVVLRNTDYYDIDSFEEI